MVIWQQVVYKLLDDIEALEMKIDKLEKEPQSHQLEEHSSLCRVMRNLYPKKEVLK